MDSLWTGHTKTAVVKWQFSRQRVIFQPTFHGTLWNKKNEFRLKYRSVKIISIQKHCLFHVVRQLIVSTIHPIFVSGMAFRISLDRT